MCYTKPYTMKRWTKIFKALANTSRLKIVEFLSDGEQRNVTDIAMHIRVTMPGTSRHLSILENVGIVDNIGKEAHVFYYLNSKMPADVRKAVDHFLKH